MFADDDEYSNVLGQAPEPHENADREVHDTVLKRLALAGLPANALTTSTPSPASAIKYACFTSTAVSENDTAAAPTSQERRTDCEEEEGGDTCAVLNPAVRAADKMEIERGQEYRDEIYEYLLKRELKLLPDPHYMLKQPDVSSSMRSDLVDWLVHVVEKFNLPAESLFLAVSYVDRYLSSIAVPHNRLQLVGSAALMLAAKLDGSDVPELSEYLYTAAGNCTKEELLYMEKTVFEILSYDISAPTTYYFLQRFAAVDKAPDSVTLLAQYVCELALLDDDPFLRFPPSLIGAAALCLASHTLGRKPWSAELVLYSRYEVTYLQQCLNALHTSLSHAPSRSQKAIRKKFDSSKYHHIASVTPPSTIPS